MYTRGHLITALSLFLLPLAVLLFVAIAYGQSRPPAPDIQQQTDDILLLWRVMGWPGLAAGGISLALSLFRFMAFRQWDNWPRWARYGLAVGTAASGACVAALVQAATGTTGIESGAILASIIKGALSGAAMVGIVEGAKTIKAPAALRSLSKPLSRTARLD